MEVVSIKKNSRFQMKTDTCGQGLNKQNNNARTSNIFVYFSDVPARMWREILSSDDLRRWRDLSYYAHNTVPSQTATFLNVPEIYFPKCNARFNKN